jgi:hypothetical protein
VNAVRGLRITFELFDYELVGEDQYLGRGTFNPNFNALRVGAQEVPVRIELDILPNFKRRSNEPTVQTVAVAHHGRAVAIRPALIPAQSNPVYVTVGPYPKLAAPYSKDLHQSIRDLLPHRFPFELSVALIHPGTNSFELVNSGNRDASGAYHSGLNPCGCGDSISPAIRLDPMVLHASGVSQAVVAIATKDYSALSGIFNGPAQISVWSSPEKPASYQKGQPFAVPENSEPRIIGQVQIQFKANENVAIALRAEVLRNKSLDIKIEPVALQHPAQTATSFIPSYLRAQMELPPDFPLLIPRPISQTSLPILQARATGYRTHYLSAYGVTANFGVAWTCGQVAVTPAGSTIKYCQQVITLDLQSVPDDIALILFVVSGTTRLADEKKADGAKEPFDVVLNLSQTLFVTKYKKSKTKNTFLWFALVRDGFGVWSVVNTRIALVAQPGSQGSSKVVSAFINIIRTTLNL